MITIIKTYIWVWVAGNDYMWLASPAANSTSDLSMAYYGNAVKNYTMSEYGCSFYPIICLKSGTKLQVNGDGYKIVQ